MKQLLHLLLAATLMTGCQEPSAQQKANKVAGAATANTNPSASNFKEGRDYLVYERVRMLDKNGFSQPQEAYSILLPKGWQHQDEIIWNLPGTECPGTVMRFQASSPDGRYQIETLPNATYNWTTSQQMLEMQRNMPQSSCSQLQEPMEADAYLRNIFRNEIGNPEILEVIPNPFAVAQLKVNNEKGIQEMRSYGAGNSVFHQTAVNARVRWNDGKEGMVTVAASTLETDVPNIYNGSTDKIYTTIITDRTVFKYPATESEAAQKQFSVIMASIRTNPTWSDAMNHFWKEARRQSNVVHQETMRRNAAIYKQQMDDLIARGNQRHNERMAAMDNQMRSWEASQNSQDRMHTEFVKTIRGVENYQDASGKFEMSSGYDHAWSRGDGNSFIMTNNPNFDPSSVLQDQNWKQMKKVQ